MTVDNLPPTMRRHIRLAGGHWIWTGATNGSRGVPMWGGASVVRIIWDQLVYLLGSSERLWRTCTERACVNPDRHEMRAGARR